MRDLIDRGKAIALVRSLEEFYTEDNSYGKGYRDCVEVVDSILRSMSGEEPAHLCNSCKYVYPVCQAKAKFESCREKILHCWRYEDRYK